MTEKEKMILGEKYNPMDEILVKDRKIAKKLCFEFNHLDPRNSSEKRLILKSLFQADTIPFVQPTFYCDYGYNIRVGQDVFFNHNCVILDVCEVTIGHNTMFANNVQIVTATHPTDPYERINGLELGKSIKIGKRCWLGAGVIVCPGVTIGDNVTIGAGSVVVKNIPSNCVAVGNPCKVIKNIEIEE